MAKHCVVSHLSRLFPTRGALPLAYIFIFANGNFLSRVLPFNFYNVTTFNVQLPEMMKKSGGFGFQIVIGTGPYLYSGQT